MPEEIYEGIRCPNPQCLALEKRKQVGNGKKSLDAFTRTKECKICGTLFTTCEVYIGVIEIKNPIPVAG